MKIKITVFLLLFIGILGANNLALNPCKANVKNTKLNTTTTYRLTNYNYYVYNYSQSNFEHKLKYQYYFSGNYYADSLTIDTLKTNNWEKHYKYKYVYNENSYLIQNTLYKPVNNNWVFDFDDYYTYNDDGTTSQYLSKKYNGSSFENFLKISYEYQNGFLTNETWEYFNTRQAGYYCTYQLNDDNLVTQKTWYYIQNNEAYSRVNYTYNSEKYLQTELWQTYADNAWKDYSKYQYQYTDNNLYSQVNGFLYTENAWQNYSQKIWEYNANGNNSLQSYKLWDTSLNEFVYQYKYEYFYDEFIVSTNNDVFANFVNLKSYPNPFNPSCKISFNCKNAKNASLAIYNLKGQKVKQYTNFKNGKNVVNFNGKNLSSGVYFYKLTVDNKSTCKKMIMLK